MTIAADGVLAVVDQEAMRTAWRSAPGLEAALWRYCFVKSAALEEWLLNIGKRSPTGRVAHLLMELRSRLNAVHSTDPASTALYVTARDVADAMGVHEVVAKRVLGEISATKAIRRHGNEIVVEDPERLAKLGEFQPDYLHMEAG